MKCVGTQAGHSILALRIAATTAVTMAAMVLGVGGLTPANAAEDITQKQISDDTNRQINAAVKAAVTNAVRGARKSAGNQKQTQRQSVVVGTDSDMFAGAAIGIWGNPSYSKTKIDAPDTETDTDSYTGLIGGDLLFNEKILVGLALGVAKSSSESTFQVTGGAFFDADQDVRSRSLSPYIAYIISPKFAVDASVTILSLNTDSFSVARATGVTALDVDQDSRVRSASVNVNYFDNFENVEVNGSFGLSRSISIVGAAAPTVGANIISSGSDRTTMTIGASAGYAMDKFFPYVGGNFEHAFNEATATGFATGASGAGIDFDHSFFGWYAGVDYTPTDQLTATLELNTVSGRSNTDVYGLMVNLRYDF